MLNHYDKARLGRAAQEAGNTDVDSVVLAIMKDNGQVLIHNIGDTEGRKALYDTVAEARGKAMCEMSARFTMHAEGGAE